MGELKKIIFKEFVTLQRGFDLPKKNMKSGIYPVIGSTSIIGYHDEFKVDPPGVVTGRSGALGSVQYIPVKYWPHNTSLWIKDFKGNLPKYTYYFLQTLGLQHFNSGAAVPTLNRNDLDTLELKIHNPSIQRKIAAILSTYDDLIENNTRRIEILEEIAQAIYREWFVEFRFPGHGQVPMVELGLIPQGWEVKQLGEIVLEIIDYRGKTPKKLGGDWAESGIMALSAMNVKQGKLVNLEKAKFVSKQLYEKWMKSEITKNDILMTSEAPLGEVYYLTEKKKVCLSQRLYCIRANPNIIKPSLLFYAISSPSVQSQLHANATGTTVLGIRQTALRKISVIIPPLQLQSKAETVLETLLTTKETLEKKNTNLRQTRDLLLPKLISGEIDVSELEIDTDGIERE